MPLLSSCNNTLPASVSLASTASFNCLSIFDVTIYALCPWRAEAADGIKR